MRITNDNALVKSSTYSHEYLYNKDITYFSNLKYIDAIKEKIRLGKELLRKLNDKLDYTASKEEYEKMNNRIKDVIKAIEFNKLLLKEYEKYTSS